ncbi:unnamed protein product, partial [Ixodes pacificus]
FLTSQFYTSSHRSTESNAPVITCLNDDTNDDINLTATWRFRSATLKFSSTRSGRADKPPGTPSITRALRQVRPASDSLPYDHSTTHGSPARGGPKSFKLARETKYDMNGFQNDDERRSIMLDGGAAKT